MKHIFSRLSSWLDTSRLAKENDSSGTASNAIKIIGSQLGSQLRSKLGDLLASTKTVLPWIMTAAGAPTFFAAALAPIRESGDLSPQLLIGRVIAPYQAKKGFYVSDAVIQGLCIGTIGIGSLLLSGQIFGLLSLVMTAIFSLARALCSLTSKDVVGKTIPRKRRGALVE